MHLIFATNNQHKVTEIRKALPPAFTILPLREAGIDIDIPEPHDTLEENALEKAAIIRRLSGTDCFSEDTGLEVDALNGAPGVRSARYAGEEQSFEANVRLLMHNLEGISDRRARFRTVICLIWQGQTHYFEGVCEGVITEAPTGAGGFGYDPVFMPNGASRTFAEMSLDEKNQYSHRRKALDKLVSFLNPSNPKTAD